MRQAFVVVPAVVRDGGSARGRTRWSQQGTPARAAPRARRVGTEDLHAAGAPSGRSSAAGRAPAADRLAPGADDVLPLPRSMKIVPAPRAIHPNTGQDAISRRRGTGSVQQARTRMSTYERGSKRQEDPLRLSLDVALDRIAQGLPQAAGGAHPARPPAAGATRRRRGSRRNRRRTIAGACKRYGPAHGYSVAVNPGDSMVRKSPFSNRAAGPDRCRSTGNASASGGRATTTCLFRANEPLPPPPGPEKRDDGGTSRISEPEPRP
jgi:hypothetical protein